MFFVTGTSDMSRESISVQDYSAEDSQSSFDTQVSVAPSYPPPGGGAALLTASAHGDPRPDTGAPQQPDSLEQQPLDKVRRTHEGWFRQKMNFENRVSRACGQFDFEQQKVS